MLCKFFGTKCFQTILIDSLRKSLFDGVSMTFYQVQAVNCRFEWGNNFSWIWIDKWSLTEDRMRYAIAFTVPDVESTQMQRALCVLHSASQLSITPCLSRSHREVCLLLFPNPTASISEGQLTTRDWSLYGWK